MMRTIINNRIARLATIFSLAIGAVACSDDSDDMLPYVDLRFNAADSYSLTAATPEVITFEVKSDYAWEILSNEDWLSVTPDSGEAGKITTITVTCQENTDLDDRTDILSIKSDHWVGKKVELFQKGTAYLDFAQDGVYRIGDEQGATGTATFTANQKWTIALDEDYSWFRLTNAATSGEGDGSVSYEVDENKGAERTALINVYDRHGVLSGAISVTQDGVLLTLSDEELRYASYIKRTISFDVNSNSTWKVEKGSEYDMWYTIVDESGTENGTVTIELSANEGVSMRSATINVSSVSDDPDAIPVVQSIVVKQACIPDHSIVEMEPTNISFYYNTHGTPQFVDGDLIVAEGEYGRIQTYAANTFTTVMGRHFYKLKDMSATATPIIFHCVTGGAGYWASQMSVLLSGATGLASGANYQAHGSVVSTVSNAEAFDYTEEQIVEIRMSEVEGQPTQLMIEATLNYGDPFYTLIVENGGTTNFNLLLGANTGYAVWDYYGYAAPLEW